MNWKKLLLFSGLDVIAVFVMAILFALFFLFPLQSALLDSINTIDYEQTVEGYTASIASTEMVTIILIGMVLIAYALFFLSDTMKIVILHKKKEKMLEYVGKNALTWVAFVCLTIIVGILLQEFYFFFAFLSFLKPVYIVIASVVSVMVVFLTLFIGKKDLFRKKFTFKQILIQWILFGVLAGILIATFNAVLISLTLLLFLFLGNYTLLVATRP